MSKRSVRKVRHYHPAPSIKNRVESAKSITDGGDEINLMSVWKENNVRHGSTFAEKLADEG